MKTNSFFYLSVCIFLVIGSVSGVPSKKQKGSVSINRGRKNQFLLHKAVEDNDKERLQALLAPGKRGQVNWRALINATKHDVPINQLIAGVPQVTALHYAVRKGNPCVVQILVDQGAEVDAKNCLDETPFHYLTKQSKYYVRDVPYSNTHSMCVRKQFSIDFYTIAALLMRHGADVTTRDYLRRTPLHTLCRDKAPKWPLIKKLLHAGASPIDRDHMQESAYDCFATSDVNRQKFRESVLECRAQYGNALQLVRAHQKKHGQSWYLPDLVIKTIVDYACPLVD